MSLSKEWQAQKTDIEAPRHKVSVRVPRGERVGMPHYAGRVGMPLSPRALCRPFSSPAHPQCISYCAQQAAWACTLVMWYVYGDCVDS